MQKDYILNNSQTKTLKETYIKNIITLLNKCEDISLLDLIERLLKKSI
jgi:hypothetical protein